MSISARLRHHDAEYDGAAAARLDGEEREPARDTAAREPARVDVPIQRGHHRGFMPIRTAANTDSHCWCTGLCAARHHLMATDACLEDPSSRLALLSGIRRVDSGRTLTLRGSDRPREVGPVFLVALIAGVLIGWFATESPIGAIGGGVVAVVVVFVLQAAVGIAVTGRARGAVPVDLSTPTPDPLTPDAYAGLPLAARNAVIVRIVSLTSGRSAEHIVTLLPELMGRQRVSNIATQEAAASLVADLNAACVPRASVSSVCAAEVRLAGKAALPANDRVRAIVERNWGGAVDETTMAQAILTSRLPRIDRTVTQLVDDAMSGRADLAFVVGTIRKVGEFHAREMAKIR